MSFWKGLSHALSKEGLYDVSTERKQLKAIEGKEGRKTDRKKETEPFLKRQILKCSKLKELADDHFKFDENGRKFSKRAEITMGKGEIARHEQFRLFPQWFQKICMADT